MRAPDPAELTRYVRPCTDCRRPIMWAWTVASQQRQQMPLDAEPVPTGNVLAYPDPKGRRLLCDVIGSKPRRTAMAEDGWRFFQHHRMSCPRAEQWARQQTAPARLPAPPRSEGSLW